MAAMPIPASGKAGQSRRSKVSEVWSSDTARDTQLLGRLFAAEDAAMAAGTVGTDFATVTAVAPSAPAWRRLLAYNPISRSSPSSLARQAGKDSTASA